MAELDLSFNMEQGKFNYRVGAIIIHNNKLLMCKSHTANYYYSVGGRVRLNESAEEAVIREVYEEIGIHMEIERLAYINESFFVEEGAKERFHELSFFFFMKDMDELDTISLSFIEDGVKEELYWIPLEELKSTYLYPEFFKEKLLIPSFGVEHILTRE